MKLDPGARSVVERLRASGFQALLAGGCVRDWLLKRTPKDWDVVTDADPTQVAALFERTIPVGARFGIVIVMWDGKPYEVARFRSDHEYADGRRPVQVDFADARTDALRRDFTVNGMFLDPVTGELIDYVGGQDDLQAHVLRAIGDAHARFAEDHLRMVRAVRLAASLDFDIAAGTWAAVQEHASSVVRISAERIRDELTRILTEGAAPRGMQLLRESGLLAPILPEVAALKGVEQPPEFHPEGDVWTHTLLVLEHLRAPGAVLAWAALLHDIGKPPTQVVGDRIRFHGHDAVGADMARDIGRRLRMPSEDVARIGRLVEQHMRLRHALDMRPGKLKRLLREPYFNELLELHRADCLASHGDLSLYDFCCRQLEQLKPESLRPPRVLSGHDLQRLGFQPGPVFHRILDAVEEEQLEGRIRTRQEAEAYVLRRFGPERRAPEPE